MTYKSHDDCENTFSNSPQSESSMRTEKSYITKPIITHIQSEIPNVLQNDSSFFVESHVKFNSLW